MQNSTIFRLSAVAAIAGGILRFANSFTMQTLSPHVLDLLYLLTDILLMLGLIGWYSARAKSIGISGMMGFVAGVIGFLVIRSAAIFPGYGYVMGAAVLLLGLGAMSVAELFTRPDRIVTPMIWLLSFGAAIVSLIEPSYSNLAGELVGVGFVGAGADLLRKARIA